MRRRAVGPAALVLCIAAGTTTRAGDPEAHASAAIKAAKRIADRPAYAMGVGAPIVAGYTQEGMFQINTEGNEACPYDPSADFLRENCPYTAINGFSINEPDHWQCIDPDQPPLMNSLNALTSPSQIGLTGLSSRKSEAAMVCNWNHFVDNGALRQNGNSGTQRAYETTRDWAEELLTTIEEEGAGPQIACNEVTWREYYSRSVAALHYIQDSATEHHAEGNIECAMEPFNPTFSPVPLFDPRTAFPCMLFINTTLDSVTGNNPQYWCDEAIAAPGTRDDVQLSDDIAKVALACGWGGATPMVSFACMGLERTLRHHCELDEPKTLKCQGEPTDHFDAESNETWCEGEIYPGPGGEDFISRAVDASEPLLLAAVGRWAEVCKEPDDPCDATQCDNWCERSEGLTGYCVNAAPDTACVLHQCICDDIDACGGQGMPCCIDASPCGSGLECGAQTGTCIAEGTEECSCDNSPIPTSKTWGHWTGETDSAGCHYEEIDVIHRFNLVPGARRYVVSAGAGGVGVFQDGWELKEATPGQLSASYFTAEDETGRETVETFGLPPLAEGEAIFISFRGNSGPLCPGVPDNIEDWEAYQDTFPAEIFDPIAIDLIPQCD